MTLSKDTTQTLMIIGAGAEQIPVYKAARERGLRVVGTDMNPAAPAFKFADHRLLASTRDIETTVNQAMAFASKNRVDGVMTAANDVPLTVATVAHALGLPGIPVDSANRVTDKVRMKEAFMQAGVACPWFSPVTDVAHLQALYQERLAMGVQRLVLKPVDGRGARGVLLLDKFADLQWAFAESQRWSDSGRLILEEFIPGMQLSTESYLIDGQVFTPAIAERNYEYLDRFSPYIIENGGNIPAPLSAEKKRLIDQLIAEGAQALGVSEGIVKGDLVLNGDGDPLIIELALRLSGGWLATDQIPVATGVSLVDAAISFALGEAVTADQLQPHYDRATAIRYWFPPEGTIVGISGKACLAKTPGLLSYGFFRRVGEQQPPIRMHSDRFGYLIVQAKNRQQALARVREGLASLDIEVLS